MDRDSAAKQKVAEAAIELVEDGSVIGVGSGSTVAHFIEELRKSGKKVQAVPTSLDTLFRLASAGVPVTTLHHVGMLDVCFDGADQVDPWFNMIKGGGGALTMEKLVAYSARRMVVLVDSSKLVERLGGGVPVPLELIPNAFPLVSRELGDEAKVEFRVAKGKLQPVISDNGLALADVWFKNGVAEPKLMEKKLKLLTGVIESGLFCRTDDVLVLASDGGKVWSPRRRV
ncbi:MAG: ribose-5-phosphate isomerase RpiA [Thermoprotei archaeon]